MLYISLTCEQDPKTLELLHLRQGLSTDPKSNSPFGRESWPWAWRSSFSSEPLPTGLQTAQVLIVGPGSMNPTCSHHLQKPETQSKPYSCSNHTGTKWTLTEGPGLLSPGAHPHTVEHLFQIHKSTCGLVLQTLMNPQAPDTECGAVPVFSIGPPESEFQLSISLSPALWSRLYRRGWGVWFII